MVLRHRQIIITETVMIDQIEGKNRVEKSQVVVVVVVVTVADTPIHHMIQTKIVSIQIDLKIRMHFYLKDYFIGNFWGVSWRVLLLELNY